MKQILALSHVRKSFDGKVVLGDVTLGFVPGAKIGVVGPNGMGKSTLLRLMAGLERPSSGEVRLMPGYGAGILPQEPVLDEGGTVLAAVEEGVAGTLAVIGRYSQVAAKQADAVCHGAGHGRLRFWKTADAVVFEVSDDGAATICQRPGCKRCLAAGGRDCMTAGTEG